jgi:hypothetical protein
MDGQEILGMSDEDFLAQMGTLQETTATAPTEEVSPPTEEQSVEVEAQVQEADQEQATETAPATEVATEATTQPTTGEATPTPGSETTAPAAEVEPSKPAAETASVDYKAFHDQVMAPFQANGKTIQLRSVDEAIQLMQQGANYTRKMQAIAPHRKVLMMLENNGLLDESKLSRLIDLEKKNPDAIRALVKEAGIDPLDIDVHGESTYTPGNHAVPDEAVAFQTSLDEVSSTPDGQETVRQITASWDPESKAELWKDPSILGTIHQQRISGVYDRVVAEIERQRTIGAIPANVSLLNAYRVIGERMTQAGAFQDLVAAQQAAQRPAVQHPVATRVASTAKPVVTNSGKVSIAAPTRTATPRRAEAFINPLAMSDDEFMKQFANRV